MDIVILDSCVLLHDLTTSMMQIYAFLTTLEKMATYFNGCAFFEQNDGQLSHISHYQCCAIIHHVCHNYLVQPIAIASCFNL
jgi:hypothetical protein